MSVLTVTPRRSLLAAQAFNPLSLGDAKLWLDFNRLTLADAAQIASVTDLAGVSAGLVQGTAANRPTARVGVQNGKAVGRWDAVDDFLQDTGYTGLNSLTGATLFVVAKNNTPASNCFAFGGAVAKFSVQLFSNELYFKADASNYGKVAFTSTAWRVIEYVYDGTAGTNAGRAAMLLDGVQQTLAYTGTIPASLTATSGLEIGRLVGTAGTTWDGDIGEVLLYGTTKSSGARAAVRAYLGKKWGIAVA